MAKYYRQKERTQENYSDTMKYQPCWTCKKCFGGCSWSRDFEPIPGWIATPNTIPENGEHAATYKILYCPQYIKESR